MRVSTPSVWLMYLRVYPFNNNNTIHENMKKAWNSDVKNVLLFLLST